jgi:hypothetical protein
MTLHSYLHRTGQHGPGRGPAPSASMTMAVLTGVALLCYGVSLYLAGSPGRLPPAQ